MFGRKYREQLNALENRVLSQNTEIDRLRLELSAYRDHGIVFGRMYKHKDREYYFEMNADTYLNIERSNTFFDDYVQVAYQLIDNDVDVSVDVDITDAEEEISKLRVELAQAQLDATIAWANTISDLALRQLHDMSDEITERPMNIVVVVSKPNDYCKDGVRLMTPEQVLDGECDGIKIDDYLLSSEVLYHSNVTLLENIDECLSNAMATSDRRL